MSHIASVNGCFSTLDGRKHVACMPDACYDVVLHHVTSAIRRTHCDTTVEAKPGIVRRVQDSGICSDSVDDVLFDYEVLATATDTNPDKVMNHIALEGHFVRFMDEDTMTIARGDGRIRNLLDTNCRMVELEGRLFSCFLGATVDGHIVKVDISCAILVISRPLSEFCDEELAAPRIRVSHSHTSFISIGCDVDVAAEEEDFAAHVNASVTVCSRKRPTEMIACQLLCQRDYARVFIIAFNYNGFTVVDLDISGGKT